MDIYIYIFLVDFLLVLDFSKTKNMKINGLLCSNGSPVLSVFKIIFEYFFHANSFLLNYFKTRKFQNKVKID